MNRIRANRLIATSLIVIGLCCVAILSRAEAAAERSGHERHAEKPQAQKLWLNPKASPSERETALGLINSNPIGQALDAACAYSGSYQNRNVDDVLLFCSTGLKGRPGFKQSMTDTFQQNSEIRLKHVTVKKLMSTDDMVLVREELDWRLKNAKTYVSDASHVVRILRVIREGHDWVVDDEQNATDDVGDVAHELVLSPLVSGTSVSMDSDIMGDALVSSLISQANSQYMQKYDYSHAVDAFSWAVSFAKQDLGKTAGANQWYANAVNWLISAEVSAGTFASAIGDQTRSEIYNKDVLKQYAEYSLLIQQYPALSTPIFLTPLHNLLGAAYQGLGQKDQSLSLYKLALREATDQKISGWIGYALTAIGNLQREKTDSDAELKVYQDYYLQRKQYEDKAAMATALDLLGVYYLRKGDQLQALNNLEEEKQLRVELNDDNGTANVWMTVGAVYFRGGNYTDAQNGYEQARQIYERTKNNVGLADVWRCCSSVYYRQGKYAPSLEYALKGLELAEQENNLPEIVHLYQCIGATYEAQGNYVQAFNFSQACAHDAAIVNDPTDQNSGVLGMANIFLYQGDYDLALEQMKTIESISVKVPDPGETNENLRMMCNIWDKKGDYPQALQYIEKAIALDQSEGEPTATAPSYLALGNVLAHQGYTDKALEAYNTGLKIAQDAKAWASVTGAYTSIGEILSSEGEYAKALLQYQQALKTIDSTALIDLAACYTEIGYCDYRLMQYDDAAEASRKAIQYVETVRAQVVGGPEEQQLFFQHEIRPYQILTLVLLVQHRDDEAFACAEQSKARVLRESFDRGPEMIPLTADEKIQSSIFAARLASINTQLQTAKQQVLDTTALLEVQKRVRLEKQLWQTILHNRHVQPAPPHTIQTVDYEEAARLLPNTNAAFLEFAVFGNRTFLFVLTKQGGQPLHKVYPIKVYPIDVSAADLTKLVNQFRDDIAGRDEQPEFYAEARHLYKLLLGGSVEDQLKGISRFCIVPDGPLWDLPFQALQSDDGQYLLDTHSVFFTPSLTTLREIKLRERHPSMYNRSMLLAIGNPALIGNSQRTTLGQKKAPASIAEAMGDSFQPLPQAEAQVNAIAAVYGKSYCKVLVGENASEDRVKAEMGKYSVLQFATHGVANRVNPMYSFLLLSQKHKANDEDGMLYATDVMQMHLNAQLVVLAACDTARGRVRTGEGLVGLMWAFLHAGCPNVIASQWQIDAGPTTRLIVGFHSNLKGLLALGANGSTITKALRDAALKIRTTQLYSHPYYWAPFVLTGDGFSEMSPEQTVHRPKL